MEKKDAIRLFNSIRKENINARSTVELASEDLPSGKMFLDYMTTKYTYDHYELFLFLNSDETFNLIKSKLPENGKGYIQIYVRREVSAFKPYSVEFVPYRIIQKEWGLGYKNTNAKDFVFFLCLYENDYTKFRGCFKK